MQIEIQPCSLHLYSLLMRAQVKFAKDGSSRDSAAASPAPSVESLTPAELNQPLSTVPQTTR